MHMVYTIALSRVQRTRQENRCTLRRKPLKAIKPGFASKWASVRSPAPRQHGLENTGEVSIMSMHTSVNHVSAPCREGEPSVALPTVQSVSGDHWCECMATSGSPAWTCTRTKFLKYHGLGTDAVVID